MNTEKTSKILSIRSENAEKTEFIGGLIGRQLKGGEVILLNSDLGGGKTTFVRGLVDGMGSKDKVTSPSFKISNTYQANGLVINHFDFYRLQDPGLLVYELSDSFDDKNIVTIIEWSDIVQDVLPVNRLEIQIKTEGQDLREFEIQYNNSSEYMVNLLKEQTN